MLIRRLKAFAGGDITCIGTSATLADPERGTEGAARFAHRFFGVPQDKVAVVEERYVEVEWPGTGCVPALTDRGCHGHPGEPAGHGHRGGLGGHCRS